MTGSPTFLRNRWYVAALSTEIGKKPLARTLLGEPVVFYRDTRGQVVALEDRCVHRQAPLSLGEVVGDHLQCGYHGFTYDRSGTCVRVPSQPRIPPGACVRAYPVTERYGFVHMWAGDPALADTSEPYDFPFVGRDGWNARYATFYGRFDYRLLMDNLTDLTHLAFTHKQTIGAAGVAEQARARVERDGERVRITRLMEDIAPAPAHVEVTGYAGNVDRWQIIEFTPPGFVWLDVGNARAGKGGRDATPGDMLVERMTLHIATPETATTTHYFWVSTYPAASMTPEGEQLMYDRSVETFLEDIAMIEGQQTRLDPAIPTVDAGQDAGQLAMRQTLDRLIAEENATMRVKAVGG
jgi:phenylpropionate dioxygenase-like ring-hydroxylating dioxygenase large terminal subunit